MKEDQAELKREERTRRPPDRLDPSWATPVGRKKKEQVQIEEVEPASPASPKKEGPSLMSRILGFGRKQDSARSASTTSSAVRRRSQAEAAHQAKIAAVLQEISELEEAMELHECEVQSLKTEIQRKSALINPTLPSYKPEEAEKFKQEIAVMSDELIILRNKCEPDNIRSRGKIKRLRIQLDLLHAEQKAELAEIDDDEEQRLSDDGSGSDDDPEETERKLEAWRAGVVAAAKAEMAPPVEKKEESAVMDNIAQSLQALVKISSNPAPRTDIQEKMLVRQSIGRDLPIFSGRPEEWPTFVATFKRTTESCGFTDAENIERIRKCVRGEAAKSVECLLVSPDSLGAVLRILQEKFGQPEVIVRSMIAKAKSSPPVKEGKPQTMIDFGTTVVNLVATIRNLGEMEHLRNPVLLHELVEKLPDNNRQTWEMEVLKSGQRPTLEDFSEWVQMYVKIACRMVPLKSSTESKSENSTKGRGHHHEKENVATAAGLFSGQVSKSCFFCGKNNHYSSECYRAERMSQEEKNELIKKNKACFKCLRFGHAMRDCKVKVSCGKCRRPHCKSMCPEMAVLNRHRQEQQQPMEEPTNNAHNSNHSCRKDVLLKTVVVRLVGPKGSKVVRLLFDEGSQKSNGRSSTLEAIGSKVVGEEWSRNVLFGGMVTEPKKVKECLVRVESLDGTIRQDLHLRKSEVICGAIPRVPSGPWMHELQRKKIWIGDFEKSKLDSQEIEVLVGSDYWGQLVVGKPIRLNCDLFAVKTVFGWTLSGPVPGWRESGVAMACTSLHVGEASVSDLWDLEVIGIRDPADVKSREEKEEGAREHFRRSVVREEDGRYSVAMPWVEGKAPIIPNNKAVALKRLESATTKLMKTEDFEKYDEIFSAWLSEGIIEEVSESEISAASHYLPHRPVFKPESETTPVRPVFDASCKVGRAPSLNDCMEKGPNLIELISSILLRFREKKIGLVSDIRKAFQMISVNKTDRDFLRFLWWEDKERKKLREFRHCRVVFGVNCSPFLLAAVLQDLLEKVDDERKSVALKLLSSLYVDNCVASVDTEEEYEIFKREATEIMASAKMELRQWECSVVGAPGVGLSAIRGCGLGDDDNDTPLDSTTMVLGLAWNRERDSLRCNFVKLEMTEKLTKRRILSTVQKIFDPIGFTAPVTLKPKMILQKVWAEKMDWDAELPTEIVESFRKWYEELHFLTKIDIPRWIMGQRKEKEDDLQLHVFCDASQDAYAAVVYLRSENEDGSVTVQLLQAKSRVAPLKRSTIPRLELLGCVIAARLYSSVKKSLGMEDVSSFFWTDSTTALAWIRRNNDWGTFVGNRVRNILELTDAEDWRHVPGVQNPADLPSRGCNARELLESKWEDAEKQILKMQRETFENGVGVVNGMVVEKDSEDILRVNSKLLHSEHGEAFRRPILLPSCHPTVEQMIREEHVMNGHAGAQFLMGKLRERVWILRGRKTITKVLSGCVTCRRFGAKKVDVPPAALPADRVNLVKAFQVTGVDLAGPLFLQDGSKVWICLFTCAVYRCVHFELVTALSTAAFLLALERFISRRGRPATIYSDNGTNFVGAANMFKTMDWERIVRETGSRRIQWKFNPPTASWWGGWWERLVRNMKDLLKRMLGTRRLNYDQLQSCVCSVEAVVNQRPLTYVTERGDDLVPLTPAMFLQEIQNNDFPEAELLSGDDLRKKARGLKILREELRERFRKEYLSILVQRGSERKLDNLQVGDVVLIGADGKKRLDWPMGRIMEFLPGKDGKVRLARVKTASSTVLRPLQRLYPLEVSSELEVESFLPRVNERVVQEAQKTAEKVEVIKTTRRGREVKKPVRFGSVSFV